MDIRENIKRAAKAHDTTLEAVAGRLGINKVTVYRNIAGNVTLSTLQRIADAIPCNISEFFRDDRLTFVCPCCGKTLQLYITAEEISTEAKKTCYNKK